MNAIDRAEFIADIPFVAGAKKQLPTNGGLIPNDRYMYGFRMILEGRYKPHATLGPSAILADAPYSLLQRVTVKGTHKARGTQETPYDLRGPEIFSENRVRYGAAPISLPSAGIDKTGSAANDFRIAYDVIFPPLGVGPQQQALYLLDLPNFDMPTLEVTFGDESCIGSGQTGAGAFTAFGADTGTPRLRVSGLFAQDGQRKFAGFLPGMVKRYFAEYAGLEMTTTNTNNARLFSPAKGYDLRSVIIKTGTKGSPTAGLDVYATLSDTILQNLKLNIGLNRAIRYYPDFAALQMEALANYGILPRTGFALMDFAQKGALDMALKTAGLIGGATGDTDLYFSADTTAAASQAVLFVVEELRYRPQNVARQSGARR